MLTFLERRAGVEAVYSMEGGMVSGGLEEIRTKIKTSIEEGVATVVFDLTGVTVIDSAGVGFVAATFNTISKKKGTLKVTGLSEEMYRFFVALRLNAHFSIEKRM